MKIIDRLILRELLGPVFSSVMMFLVVVFATAWLFKLTDMLVKGVSFGLVVQIGIFTLPMMLTQTLPMGMLLGTLLAFGRLSGDSENIALHAGGISFYRICVPVALLGVAVSVVAFIWDETVVPPATARSVVLAQSALEQSFSADRKFQYTVKGKGDSVDEIVIVNGGYDTKAAVFRKVNILKFSEAGSPGGEGRAELFVYAETARPNSTDPTGADWTYGGVHLHDLRPTPRYVVDSGSRDLTTRELRSYTGADIGMKRTFKGVLQAEKPDNRSMTFRELRDKINEERRRGDLDTLGDEVDLWGKITTPLASLVFGLVAAPLGIRPQRGSKAMGFGMAIAIIFTYWTAYNWLYQLGKGGSLAPILASFAPNIIGMIAAMVLIGRVRQ